MSIEALSKLSIYRLALVCAIGVAHIVFDMCMLQNLTPTLTFGFLGGIACFIAPKNNFLTLAICCLEGYFLNKKHMENQIEAENNNFFNAPGALNRFDAIEEENNRARPAQTVFSEELKTNIINLGSRPQEREDLKEWRATARR